MRRDLTATLEEWVAGGVREIGQILIAPEGEGFSLRHRDDADRSDLERYAGATAARELARNDAAGEFRPLKTAPNLRRGWVLAVADAAELRLALDYFYPAALGLYRSYREGALRPVDFRRTTERQTGMYAVTRRISDDEADATVGRFCTSDGGCLRTILWKIDESRPVSSLPWEKFDPARARGIPLLCREACNLLVAEARRVVRKPA